ncbi:MULTISPECIES: hypothetical protein [unclassified Microcoleus]|uniref:hypothetical protein n=1 Tax=unclassified Microcoleus TaxID=2642155 RepID=UPI002FD6981B
MEPLADFLKPEECAEVDRALLSSKEKFSTRLAIYGLRVLKQIAGETGLPITEVSNQQVMDWIKNDESIQRSIQVDASFENFFTNLVVASLRPLKQIAAESESAIEQLTVKQVVAWFVKDGKVRREQGTDAAFLDL